MILGLAAAAGALALANGLHCAGMCGAFSVLTKSHPAWHAGRATTYLALGAVAGGLGAAAGAAAGWPALRIGGAVLASVALLAFSLHLGGWSSPASRLVAPIARLARGASTHRGRFLLGAAGSLVPCGAVYGALALAASAGSAAGGALVMGSFALGTAPALGILGLAPHVRRLGRSPTLRRAVAGFALALGLATIWARAPLSVTDPAPPSCHNPSGATP